MKVYVFDIEANSLTPTKIHCLSANTRKGIKTTVEYSKMRDVLISADVLIGHNIIRYDIPALERLLGIEIKAKLVDTLALSWYLYPSRNRHGLADWGEHFGVPKPKVDDWENLPIEVYKHRCEEDVSINSLLWEKQWKYLNRLYDTEDEVWNLIDYLSFKMVSAAKAEKSGWLLDLPKCEAGILELDKDLQEKIDVLKRYMPAKPVIKRRERPSKPFKKDGGVSASGSKWFNLLRQHGYDDNYNGEIEEVVGSEDPKPSSPDQVKNWLYSLGWVPDTFKYVRDKETNTFRKIPQVRKKVDEVTQLCHSVLELGSKSNGIEALEGITVLAHRLAILKGFLANADPEGYVPASIQGFTNTLRFKHTVLVNLPGAFIPYGELIRGCLKAPEGYELCGSDMVGLEDRTKQHYMYKYDPDYVEEMNTPGFDPHLDICLLANFLTLDQVEDHKAKRVSYKVIRHKGKTTNYSCTYGAQGPTVARAAGIPEEEGNTLVGVYWKRNWSLKAIADDCVVKTVTDGGERQKWLYNPVSKMWYTLRYDKDRFSTLNQGTGAFIFDLWLKYVLSKRDQVTGQFHDEFILTVKEGYREEATKLIRWAIDKVNEELQLNKEMDVDIQFGKNYSEIH